MPLYEYRCLKCGRQVEKIQKFSDPPLKKCEHCGGRLERLVSPPAIQFKGSGWYVTDYARKSPPSEGAKPESATATPSDGSGPTGEKKKAEKPAPASPSSETKTSKESKSSK